MQNQFMGKSCNESSNDAKYTCSVLSGLGSVCDRSTSVPVLSDGLRQSRNLVCGSLELLHCSLLTGSCARWASGWFAFYLAYWKKPSKPWYICKLHGIKCHFPRCCGHAQVTWLLTLWTLGSPGTQHINPNCSYNGHNAANQRGKFLWCRVMQESYRQWTIYQGSRKNCQCL